MNLQEQLKKDLISAIKSKDDSRKNAIRVVMGELGRSDKKSVPDDDVIKIIKKLIKSEKEVLEKSGNTGDSPFIRHIETYLPQMASDQDVLDWINENVDFSLFNNKMQAMGMIMKHFGSSVDGNRVKKILQGI